MSAAVPDPKELVNTTLNCSNSADALIVPFAKSPIPLANLPIA